VAKQYLLTSHLIKGHGQLLTMPKLIKASLFLPCRSDLSIYASQPKRFADTPGCSTHAGLRSKASSCAMKVSGRLDALATFVN
jgi:hypothetical protein